MNVISHKKIIKHNEHRSTQHKFSCVFLYRSVDRDGHIICEKKILNTRRTQHEVIKHNHKAEILAITDTASHRGASIRSAVLPAIIETGIA